MVRLLPVKRAGAAECNRARVTENLPLPLRRLDGKHRTSAVNERAFYKTAVDEVESQGLETNDCGHVFPRCQRVSGALLPVQRCRARITSSREMIPASR